MVSTPLAPTTGAASPAPTQPPGRTFDAGSPRIVRFLAWVEAYRAWILVGSSLWALEGAGALDYLVSSVWGQGTLLSVLAVEAECFVGLAILAEVLSSRAASADLNSKLSQALLYMAPRQVAVLAQAQDLSGATRGEPKTEATPPAASEPLIRGPAPAHDPVPPPPPPAPKA